MKTPTPYQKLGFIMDVEYKTGDSKRICIIDTTWNGATARAKHLLGDSNKYRLYHRECGIYIDYPTDEI